MVSFVNSAVVAGIGWTVKLADIQDGDAGYNGDEFEKQYAETAAQIYL